MWKEKEARERLRKSYDETKDLVVKPLTKEMNLENLTPTDCRVVTGVHLYLEVVNLQQHLDEAGEDKEKLRKLLRHLHVYQRVLTSLLYETEGAEKIHFQGARLHAVFYKPYDTTDVKNPALKRLGAANQFVSQAKELSKLVTAETGFSFSLEAGIENGDTIATVNGRGGSRELLFVGEAANVAAKVLTGKAGTTYGAAATPLVPNLPAPAALPERWEKTVQEECSKFPISHFDLFTPEERIDFERLGVRTAKLNAASFFADLSGFTKLVAEAADKRDLLRCLHAVRAEMHQVVRADYEGDHIQYQGDRIQGLFYEAAASSRYVSKSFEAAAAMQSVMKVCRDMFPTLGNVGITVGVDHGRVLVTYLGLKGNRDIVVLGESVPAASTLQNGAKPGQTKISKAVYDKLEETLQALFTADGTAYVSTADAEQVGAKQEARAYAGKVTVVGTASTGARVVPSPDGIQPARSWWWK
jgi:class 3 adenylate cyclase